MSSYRSFIPTRRSHFRLLDLPVELQRIIFDHCFQPWSLQIVDNYWRTSKSQYFCMDQYCCNLEYKPSILVGAPSVSLPVTCRYINSETQASVLKAYTGLLEMSIRASHSKLPKLPARFSRVYAMTTNLITDERAFVDLFRPGDFPLLKELTISCFPIFCPDNLSGRSAPLSDESFQRWAKEQQVLLERRSRKKLLSSMFVTALDSQAEQWESDESVFCYLAEDREAIQVVREKLRLPGDPLDNMMEEDSRPFEEDDHVCSRLHLDEHTTGSKIDTS